MPQSLSKVFVHLVFSTKNRYPFIALEHRETIFQYLAGVLQNLNCPVQTVGGMPDHVHLLFVQSRTMAMSEIAEELKKESSKWAKIHIHPDFYWQRGYAAFSVSPSNRKKVADYIANQERHHATMGFQDEFRHLLRRNEIEWNEEYVWD